MKKKRFIKISVLMILLFSLSIHGALLKNSMVTAVEMPETVFGHSVTISSHTVWEEVTVNGDVYVAQGATLSINGLVDIQGTLKVDGAVFSYGNLTAEKLEATNYFRGHTKDYVDGSYYSRGGSSRFGTLSVVNLNLITLPGPSLQSIEITNAPNQLTYTSGEEVSLEGLAVRGNYSDGTTENVTERMDLRAYDRSTPGEREIFVLVENQVTSFMVTYEEGPKLTVIRIVSPPDKTQYQIGEELDLEGLVVYGQYSDETEVVLPVTMDHVSGFNSSEAMENQMITVAYNGFEAVFMVDILPEVPVLTGITVITPPDRTQYYIGEELDLTGLLVHGQYSDESEVVLPVTMDQIFGFDSSDVVNSQTVTIRIEGYETTFTVEIMKPILQYTAGANRYVTAAEVSRMSLESADTAVLVSGMDYPDALAAGPLAYALGGPVLLTRPGSVHEATLNELERLGVSKVVILGGLSAISQSVEEELAGYGYEVERISGPTRNSTAAAVAEKVLELKGTVHELVLVSGENYADAIAVGSAAARNGQPILLTRSSVLSEVTKKTISESGIMKVTLVGGGSAISVEIEETLHLMGLEVKRLAGLNRALTSVEVAKYYYGEAEDAVFVNGWDYPDALSAAPLGALESAPIILVNKEAVSSGVQEYLRESSITAGIVVGGNAVVGEDTTQILQDILKEKR